MEDINSEIRNEIENIIKKQKINRKKFHEVSKFKYRDVIQKFYYSFFHYQKYPEIQFRYLWVRLRDDLNSTAPFYTSWDNWDKYIDYLDYLVPVNHSDTFYYLLIDGGWVYEETLLEIKKVLYEYPDWIEDFYLFSKKYEWLIIHCEDGACMIKVWRGNATNACVDCP